MVAQAKFVSSNQPVARLEGAQQCPLRRKVSGPSSLKGKNIVNEGSAGVGEMFFGDELIDGAAEVCWRIPVTHQNTRIFKETKLGDECKLVLIGGAHRNLPIPRFKIGGADVFCCLQPIDSLF